MKHYQEINSNFHHNGHNYDLNKILIFAEHCQVYRIKISKLDWILDETNVDERREKRANIDVPILISRWNHRWLVIDGVHRLSKAKSVGDKKILVKVIPIKFLNYCKL